MCSCKFNVYSSIAMVKWLEYRQTQKTWLEFLLCHVYKNSIHSYPARYWFYGVAVTFASIAILIVVSSPKDT